MPDNIAYMADGLQKMHRDGILPNPPHLTQMRDIYTLHVKTRDVDNNIIQQIKNIAINKKCVVEIDTCFGWLDIASGTECIDKYFE